MNAAKLDSLLIMLEKIARQQRDIIDKEAKEYFEKSPLVHNPLALRAMLSEVRHSQNHSSYIPVTDFKKNSYAYYLNVMFDASFSMRGVESLIREVIRLGVLPPLDPSNKRKRQPGSDELYIELAKYGDRVQTMIPYLPYKVVKHFDTSAYYSGGKRDVLAALMHQLTSLYYRKVYAQAYDLDSKSYGLLLVDGHSSESVYDIDQVRAVCSSVLSDEWDTNFTIIATNPEAVNLLTDLGFTKRKELILLEGKDDNPLKFAHELTHLIHDSIKHMLTRKYYADGSGKYYASKLSA